MAHYGGQLGGRGDESFQTLQCDNQTLPIVAQF